MYDRPSHGRVCPNLSLSGQVLVGAKHRATPVLCTAIGRSRPRRWSWSLCLSAEALVHVAEATSIVAQRRLPLSVYISQNVIYWFSHGSVGEVELRHQGRRAARDRRPRRPQPCLMPRSPPLLLAPLLLSHRAALSLLLTNLPRLRHRRQAKPS